MTVNQPFAPPHGLPLLDVRNLSIAFPTSDGGWARAVDGISFTLERHQTLGLVGESGCGKSTTALALLGLHASSTRVEGTVHFEGTSLLELPAQRWPTIRGRGLALVFQEPAACLNPLYSLGRQIAETVRVHQGLGRRVAWSAALDWLRMVQLTDPERVARQYPHEVSGGMQQRVMLALALAGRPRLLLADEPTSALDVTVQAEILVLLQRLRDDLGMALLLITHDLDVVGRLADQVAVMYAGKIVERGPTQEVLQRPLHPYTAALLACRPRLGQTGRLPSIEGTIPLPTAWPAGCRFRERCAHRTDQCGNEPPLEEREPGHWVACWHWESSRRSKG
jgi:oligopeptide/dipeptide ABC transporter ATP-binding protein